MSTTPDQPAEGSSPATDEQIVAAAESGDAGSVDQALAESANEGEGAFARGEALAARGANRIAESARATVIVLVGGANSGKTTLLASLYERFGRGKLAGHWFLGSRTLHGFEMRCHRSSFGSGPGGGTGGHTAGDAPPWLHLRTAHQESPHDVYELLLGDFSGDHAIRPLADGTRLPSQFPALRRADHICLTINGGAMARPDRRAAEQRLHLELLSALMNDADCIADTSAISFVVTKWDLVHKGGGEARDAVENLFEQLRTRLPEGHAARRVGYIETAARSTVPELPIGHGVGDLLSRWTDRPALHITHEPESATSAESFNRFKVIK